MQIVDVLRNQFAKALEPYNTDTAGLLQRIQASRDPRFGDYQANLVMGLAKELNRDPAELATEIVSRLDIAEICEPPEVAPRGFINLRLRNSWLGQQLKAAASDERLSIEPIANPKTYILDFSSPNVAKPMHVGHIRSTVIGDALNKILRFVGHNVITDNHLGDWGTQFGMVIYGFKHFVNAHAFADSPVAELSRLYRLVQGIISYQNAIAKLSELKTKVELSRAIFEKAEQSLAAAAGTKNEKSLAKSLRDADRNHKEAVATVESTVELISRFESDSANQRLAELHPNLDQRVLHETAKLHEGDAENRKLWDDFLPHCKAEIHQVYDRLDIAFDHELGESFYHNRLEPLVDDLLNRGTAQISEGAVCVFLPGYDAPMIIRKQDGAFLYATTDLATIEYRVDTFKPDVILYVVDHRQSEHFNKLFAAAKTLGYSELDLRHISFGTVLGPDGKPFKTRSGTVVGLESLLDEAIQRAWNVVCDPDRLSRSNLQMNDDEMRNVSQVVGIGAIKYADLVHNRTSDYEFDIDKMVKLDGQTAAYIQYGYARTQSILRNAEVNPDSNWLAKVTVDLREPSERELGLVLLKLEEVLHQSLTDYYPSVLASYLYDVSKQFASFFDQCPVIRAEDESLRDSRLSLCHITGRTLELGLRLLGIGVVPRM